MFCLCAAGTSSSSKKSINTSECNQCSLLNQTVLLVTVFICDNSAAADVWYPDCETNGFTFILISPTYDLPPLGLNNMDEIPYLNIYGRYFHIDMIWLWFQGN